eukprot:m.49882 g.49882  ORF g.49882 m.49882 type:complete len:289 (+) comp12109_c0_seq2:3064-3930(+)
MGVHCTCTVYMCMAALVAVTSVTLAGASGFYDFEATTLQGEKFTFDNFKGKVVLIANLASECGYTQGGYDGLEFLYETFGDSDLEVLGFPCNQFGQQEPGTAEEIAEFADSMGATFPIFQKIDVNGDNAHPLYTFLKDHSEEQEDVAWNFEYFVVNQSGFVVARWQTGEDLFSPDIIDFFINLGLEVSDTDDEVSEDQDAEESNNDDQGGDGAENEDEDDGTDGEDFDYVVTKDDAHDEPIPGEKTEDVYYESVDTDADVADADADADADIADAADADDAQQNQHTEL